MKSSFFLRLPNTLLILTELILSQRAYSLPLSELIKPGVLQRSNSIALYWGQNSFGQSIQPYAQQRLIHYCANTDVDIIPIAFLTQIRTQEGKEPTLNVANQSQSCSYFPGTQLLNCPQIAEDIKTCQKVYKKKILLSIGGTTFSNSGFTSIEQAISAARLLVHTFGPPAERTSPVQAPSPNAHGFNGTHSNTTYHRPCPGSGNWNNTNRGQANQVILSRSLESRSVKLRPFGDAVVDGFDLDFESSVQFSVPFAKALRSTMDADKSKKYFLTAAPECVYPNFANDRLLNADLRLDAVFVQFYNNACGLQSFTPGAPKQFDFNFQEWHNWARERQTKVFLGVPAGPTAAGNGYKTVSELEAIIQYTQRFSTFGGVMMWDASQAFANNGFISGVKGILDSTSHAKRMYRRLDV